MLRITIGLLLLGSAMTVRGQDAADGTPPGTERGAAPSTPPALKKLSGEGESLVEKKDGVHSVRALLIAPRTARISSQMRGRITSMPVGMGQRFAEGDLLVAFDCEKRRAKNAAAQAELNRARKQLESKEQLVSLDAVSELDVELAKSDVERARAELRQAKANLDDCRIHAPYDGRVVYVEANEYETVSPGDALLEIVETGNLRLEAMVPSNWLRWLKEGHAFTVHVDELDERVEARVTALGGRIDAVSQTVAIRATLQEQIPGLRPGMSGDAEFRVPES